MPQLYKTEYRRYGVQLPVELADWVDDKAKAEIKSASQVIVEAVRRGSTAEPAATMDQLYADQRTLLEIARLALDATYGAEPGKSLARDRLVSLALNAGIRQPIGHAAEPPGEYHATDNGPKERPPDKSGRTAGAGPRHRVSKSA